MYLWIDNTSLHCAGRCFEGRIQSESDISDLLQFAINLVYSGRLFMNGFACDAVAEQTSQVVDVLRKCGLPEDAIKVTSPDEKRFAAICKSAAEKSAAILQFGFQVGHGRVFGIGPDMAKPKADKYTKDVHRLVTRAWSENARFEKANEALADRAGGAIVNMVGVCPALWEAIRTLVRATGKWRMQDSEQLIGFLRYQLNVCLAEKDVEGLRAVYAPATGRAKLLRAQTENAFRQQLVNELQHGIDDVIAKLRPMNIPVPSLKDALVDRAKGDPKAVISEAMFFRDKAKGLHTWLGKIMESHDFTSPAGRSKASQAVREITRVLDYSLKEGAIDVSFSPGPLPVPSLSVRQVKEWFTYLWRKGDIIALTEMSRQAAFPGDPFGWERLLKNCSSGRKT